MSIQDKDKQEEREDRKISGIDIDIDIDDMLYEKAKNIQSQPKEEKVQQREELQEDDVKEELTEVESEKEDKEMLQEELNSQSENNSDETEEANDETEEANDETEEANDESEEAQSSSHQEQGEKYIFYDTNTDIIEMIKESLSEESINEAESVFTTILKTTLTATAQAVALDGSDTKGRKAIKDVTEELNNKELSLLSDIFLQNDLEEILKNQKDKKFDLLEEYRDIVLISHLVPDTEKKIKEKQDEFSTPFYTVNLDEIMKRKKSNGSFLYPILKFYKEILDKEIKETIVTKNRKDQIEGSKLLKKLTEEIMVFNIFEEDIFHTF